MRHWLSVGLVLVWVVACNSKPETTSDAGSAGTAGSVGTGGSSTGGFAGGGVGGTSDAGSDAGAGATGPDAAACEPVPVDLSPGPALTDPNSAGSGPCAASTLSEFIAQIHELQPDLADITQIWSDEGWDGSFIYAYRRTDGGFAVATKRGGGDCPSGCTENEYWYFDADAACAPQAVGHFKVDEFTSDGCRPSQGEAKWGRPAPIDPAVVCGTDLTAQDISGTYQLWSCGLSSACSAAAEVKPGAQETIAEFVTLTITQTPGDLSNGSVTFSGFGYPRLDGRALPATFKRRRFEAKFEKDEPGACTDKLSVEAHFDFEGFGAQSVSLRDVQTPDCANAPDDYCKGDLFATLFQK